MEQYSNSGKPSDYGGLVCSAVTSPLDQDHTQCINEALFTYRTEPHNLSSGIQESGSRQPLQGSHRSKHRLPAFPEIDHQIPMNFHQGPPMNSHTAR